MKRGVVVEYNDDFVTLLTPDGQFLKANSKLGSYEIGEEITFFPLMDEREEAATSTSRIKQRSLIDLFNSRKVRVGALSVLAIMFFMISFLPSFNNDKVYAYMSIDINPSFEVGIDNQLNVISLVPLNEEAEKLIEKLPVWENKPFNKIVDAIVAESKVEGYVYPGKEILITTVINEEDKAVQTKLEAGIDEISTSYEDQEMVVNTIESDNETREKAQNQGISTGKYIELKEEAKVVEPVKNQEQPDKSSSKANTENQSISEETTSNNQTVKEKLKSETKVKLEDVKNELKENSSSNSNVKKQSENNKNVSKQEKAAKKNEKAAKKNENAKKKPVIQKVNDKKVRQDQNDLDVQKDSNVRDKLDVKDNRNDKENKEKRSNQKENQNK
ncbi:anti-sigma factor domain-containing protein [Metabacillus bambusae]|uniref:Anti-sigma factor domain-containing protein n=1 Tax=Metabacillus bambusae TaxID=2795218 RepID=A0ABS3N8S1_9BACI|nr:anti-sigma factor domain-containing protein [Metabacillus bambusae]MBO1514436.1 anti-sigma factor domain-containing protein [Metabacillus bambusae]